MARNLWVCAAAMVLAAVMGSPAQAAQKPVTMGAAVSETFEITAIDSSARLVTLRDKAGESETIYCGPEVTRFDALKVGDKVTFTYYESIVSAIRKPGAAARPAVTEGVVRRPDGKPGATISQQLTATVTLQAIDPKVPSVTVKSDDGRVMSFKIEDKKNIENLKVGDMVEITYTRALAIGVK